MRCDRPSNSTSTTVQAKLRARQTVDQKGVPGECGGAIAAAGISSWPQVG